MAKIHDLFIVELAEVIKGYGNNPDDEDPFRLSEFYRFYELPNIAVSRENFEKMRPIEPEQPEVFSDGTLHITVDMDISKIDRILLSQKGTHYGNLFYMDDGEPKRTKGKWTPVSEGELPPVDEDGFSDYILVSFENFSVPDIGQYRVDEDGSGAFYRGDRYVPYSKCGIFVNAWMPLPERYGGQTDE